MRCFPAFTLRLIQKPRQKRDGGFGKQHENEPFAVDQIERVACNEQNRPAKFARHQKICRDHKDHKPDETE
jgi:hypothetical protein